MKTKYYLIIGLIFILLACNIKKEEPAPVYLNTVVKGNVYEMNTNKPLNGIEVTIGKEGKIDKNYSQIASRYTDSTGKYIIVNSIKDESSNYNYEITAWGDATHDSKGQDIILGDTNIIELDLARLR